MPGRGFNGPSSSSSSSGRGRGGRGSSSSSGWIPRGRGAARGGRGRGGRGGFSFTDMSTMAMDYAEKVTIEDDEDRDGDEVTASGAASTMMNASRTHTPAFAMSSAPPPSFRPVQAQPQPKPASTASPVYRSHSNQASRSHTPSFAPVGPSTYNASTSFQSHKPKHLGLGAAAPSTFASATVIGGRRNEPYSRYQSDPSLLKPVTFVKSSNVIKPTMDKEEHDLLLAQQQAEEQLKSPMAAVLPELSENIPPASPSAAVRAAQNMNRASSTESSRSSVVLPRAAASHRPSSLVDEKKPASHYSGAAWDKGKGRQMDVDLRVTSQAEEAPLFVIDTVGERREANVESESDSGRSGRNHFFDDQESDTEELYPRRLAVNGSAITQSKLSSRQGFPSLPSTTSRSATASSQATEPLHLPTTSYARTITDDIPFSLPSQPSVTELPASAVELVSNATSGATSKTRDTSRKVSKKQQKREAKERKKERKKGKKTDRAAFKASAGGNVKPARKARMNDSDIEWGSDGPPGLDENDDDEDSDDDSEEEDEVIPTASSHAQKGNNSPRSSGKKGSKRDAAIEAAMADYAANVAENDPEEMEALRSFVKSLNNREQLSIDDLDDLAEMRASDDSNANSESSDDEAFEERMLMKEFVREEGRRPKGEEEVFPVYVPAARELDSDEDAGEDKDELWKSDDELEEGMEGAWRDKGEKYMKRNRRRRRHASESEPSSQEEDGGIAEEAIREAGTAEEDGEEEEDGLQVNSTTILIVSDDDEESEIEEEDEDEEDEEDIDELDDEEIDDLLFASLRPARKRNQPPVFDTSDAFDDILQAQWRKDREKKALKRQERALARLQGKPTKANSKKAKRAAAKVRGFRSDDEDVVDMGISGGRLPEFHRINADLKNFIENSGAAEYALQPMDKKFRYAIHMIADAYNLKSKSRGNGRDRHNVLYRTQHTTVRNANMKKVQKYLSITASWSSGSNKSYSYSRSPFSSKKPGNANAGGGNAFVSKNYEGAKVGEGADRIAASNIGYGMLAKMGWAEGMQIGKTGGISEPIVAVIKTSKAGLGSGWVRYGRGQQDE